MAAKTEVQTSFQREPEKAVDWFELHKDMLVQIAENHLLYLDDFVAFSLVCRSWYNAATACNLFKLREKWVHNQMPWLMLTVCNTDVEEDAYRKTDFLKTDLVLPRVLNDIEEYDNDAMFMSEARSGREELYTRRVLNFRRCRSYMIECPQGTGRVCWGSAYGWIVTAGSDGKMFMLNPLTKTRISLPSVETFCELWYNEGGNNFVTRAVVLKVADDAQSCVEDVKNLRVVIVYSYDNVAIVKPGNTHWVEIKGGGPRIDSPLMDVTYDSNIGLIFVDNVGSLLRCKLSDEEEGLRSLRWIQPPVQFFKDRSKYYSGAYIVKCGADLLMVLRIIRRTGIDPYRTTAFQVYKYDHRHEVWAAVYDLKDIALFVGNNATMWVNARSAGCEGNHIYFTDDVCRKHRHSKDRLGGDDCGDYRNGGLDTKEKIRPLYDESNKRSSYCCSLWVQPSISARKELE